MRDVRTDEGGRGVVQKVDIHSYISKGVCVADLPQMRTGEWVQNSNLFCGRSLWMVPPRRRADDNRPAYSDVSENPSIMATTEIG